MLSDVADGKGLASMARMDEIAVGFGCVLIDDHRDSATCVADESRLKALADDYWTSWKRKRSGLAATGLSSATKA
jgi:hypothetical protein